MKYNYIPINYCEKMCYFYFLYYLQNVVIDACVLDNDSGLLQQVKHSYCCIFLPRFFKNKILESLFYVKKNINQQFKNCFSKQTKKQGGGVIIHYERKLKLVMFVLFIYLQACDITGGIYLKIPQMKGLLQYLLVCTIFIQLLI